VSLPFCNSESHHSAWTLEHGCGDGIPMGVTAAEWETMDEDEKAAARARIGCKPSTNTRPLP